MKIDDEMLALIKEEINLGDDPLKWVQGLRIVNDISNFKVEEKMIIDGALMNLERKLERLL